MDKTFRITSMAFKEGETIPDKYSGYGANVSPALHWENAPAGTKSFALICDDPDASIGIVHHWLLKDIPASVSAIPEGKNVGTPLPNIAGMLGYVGPKPPSGTHHYYFKLFALKTEKLDAKDKDALYKEVEEKKLGKAVLMGLYSHA